MLNSANKPKPINPLTRSPAKRHSLWPAGDKASCDYPAYLFWKLQSHLTKLNNRLNKSKRHTSKTLDITPSTEK